MTMTPLTAADYSDWLRYSGLYLENVSHADRYRTYQKKLSAAGLAAKIVFDFLDANAGGLDLQRWRNSHVYEIGRDAEFRVEETARSLEAIGAPRVAAKLRTLRNTSIGALLMEQRDPAKALEMMRNAGLPKMMEEFRANIAQILPGYAEKMAQAGVPVPEPKQVPPDPEAESFEQVEHLLGQFVQAHEAELRGDIAKHGDVRTQPGFDPEKRIAELDRLRLATYDREAQAEDVGKLQGFMDEIEKLVATNPKIKPGKLAKPRRAFLEVYRKYADRAADELVPAMRQALDGARQFQDRYAGVFRPKPISDEVLLQRLAAIGPFDTDIGNKQVRLRWDSPAGLACEWTEFALLIEYPIDDAKALAALLDASDRLRRRFPHHLDKIRQEVLEHFETYREWHERGGWPLEGYDRDEAGRCTPESILRHAGNGSIHLTVPEGDDGTVMIQVFFHVEWDDEHGLELFIDDEPEPTEQAEAGANVTFHDGGAAVTVEALAAFEAQFSISLPDDYRRFLLRHNGGRPEPNGLKFKMDGAALPLTVEVLFSLCGPENLSDALDIYRAYDRPAGYVPIGRGKMGTPFGTPAAALLLAAVTGPHKGKILMAFESPEELQQMFGGSGELPAEDFDNCGQIVAPSFGTLLSRLAPSRGGLAR
ncbi:MAG: SMI1/KNR4 family protein [Gemmataceae bacterium]